MTTIFFMFHNHHFKGGRGGGLTLLKKKVLIEFHLLGAKVTLILRHCNRLIFIRTFTEVTDITGIHFQDE